MPSRAAPSKPGEGESPVKASKVPSISRAFAALHVLGQSPAPLGVQAIARQLGVVTSSCYYLLRALVAGGMQTPFLLDRFPDIDRNVLQDPDNVAETVKYVLCQPAGSVIPEVMVLPMQETSWP